MYKIIVIIFLLCVGTSNLKRIDNINKFRFVGRFNNMGLSSSGIGYPSSINGVTSKNTRLTRIKRSPLVYLVPVNEERKNSDDEMTERSYPSRKIKRCKTGLCKARNISPLSGEYGNGMVKATAGESIGEPYGRPTRWKEIRTATNSVVSKLFKKETDSSENDEDNDELAESLGDNLANRQNYENDPSNRRYGGKKSDKFVCYCQKEDCPDCRPLNSRKELVGAPRIREKILAREKFKKDRYRKLLRPNDYAIPKIPLVQLPELHRKIPYDLRRKHGNANEMDVLPIVRGIPSNVHPLTVPFRVAYDPTDTYLGASGPISQEYQQKLNDIYQHVPLKQYAVASKSKSDIPRRPSASMSENNGVGSRNNDFATITNRFEENDNDKNVDPEKSIEDDALDSTMRECIKLFGREVCVLAASTNCDNFNKVKNQEDNNFVMGSNDNIGSARNYYESSSTEQSSTYRGINEDYYDITESYTKDSPYNIVNVKEDIDDRRLSNELENYHDDYYDSTIADVTSDTPEYVTNDTENDRILSDDYYNSGTPNYVFVDSTEAAILKEASSQKEDATTLLTDTNSNNNIQYNNIYNIEYQIVSPQNKSSNCDDVSNLSSSTTKIGYEASTETILDMALTTEDESSTYNSQSQNNYYYNDFTSTATEIGDVTSTDTILGDHKNRYTDETHPGLDYSDIQVVTNGYFTSKGYDGSDENYFTSFGPSAYDSHLPNDGSINVHENSPFRHVNLQATYMPEIIKDQSNLMGVLPTKSYFDLAKSRFFTDSTMNDNFNIDETTTEDGTDLLKKKSSNCEGLEHKVDDQGKESALQYGQFDPATFITPKSESESQEATTEPSLSYAISSLDFMTNNASTSDRSASFETPISIESTESGEIITIDDYTAREAILTTTDTNSIELPTSEDMIGNEETTTIVTKVYDKNFNSIVEFPDESFGKSTDSTMNEENSPKDFDTTSNLITVNDNELERSEKDANVPNNSVAESTMEHLPFCDNTVLINSIKKVINSFTTDSANLKDSSVSPNIRNEELSPEILEIPNLRSFLSLPQIENVIVKNVKNHLSKFAELPADSLTGAQPSDIIRNALRNIFGVLPNAQSKLPPKLPPNTVIEHQFRNNEWTTNLVTLVPIKPTEETKNQNSLQKVHEHVKNLIFNPVVGLQAAKQKAVRNIIVQALKHQMENANDVTVEEDTIRDMVGNVLENAYKEGQRNNDEGNSFENSSPMDTTKQIEDETNYDESSSTESEELEDFDKSIEQIPEDSFSTKNSNDNKPTTDPNIKLHTEDFVKNEQSSSTEVNERDNNSNGSPSLSEEKSINCLNQVTTDLAVKNNSININPTPTSFTEDFVGRTQFSSTEIYDKNNASNLGKERSNDYSNYVKNNNISTTATTYTEHLRENDRTEPTDISETTEDIKNINEEITLGVPCRDQRQSSESTEKNKGKTNESKVLRLPQNSFVGVGNTGIGESSSANQGRSSQGKEKCRLCKMESCTSTHEIVTKVRKKVKTTTKKYYGAKENVASEENPIVSSEHQEEDRNTIVSLESQEHINRSNNDNDDVSTTCENLSEESLRDSDEDEDLIYKEKISKKKTNDDDKDDLSVLQNSELYYIGDKVKLPLEITKLKDGSYALSISKSICENVLKKKCPCCVPLNGNVRSIKRSTAINGNTDRVTATRKSAKIRSKLSRKRSRRSTIPDRTSKKENSIFENELETLTMPVMTFAKKYNLRLNLDGERTEDTTYDQLKYINKMNGDNIRSRDRFDENTRDKSEFGEKDNIYRDKDDQFENIDTNNPVFQRMKFVNKMQQNPELYRRQRAIEGIPNNRTDIIKNLLNWLRKLILY